MCKRDVGKRPPTMLHGRQYEVESILCTSSRLRRITPSVLLNIIIRQERLAEPKFDDAQEDGE